MGDSGSLVSALAVSVGDAFFGDGDSGEVSAAVSAAYILSNGYQTADAAVGLGNRDLCGEFCTEHCSHADGGVYLRFVLAVLYPTCEPYSVEHFEPRQLPAATGLADLCERDRFERDVDRFGDSDVLAIPEAFGAPGRADNQQRCLGQRFGLFARHPIYRLSKVVTDDALVACDAASRVCTDDPRPDSSQDCVLLCVSFRRLVDPHHVVWPCGAAEL